MLHVKCYDLEMTIGTIHVFIEQLKFRKRDAALKICSHLHFVTVVNDFEGYGIENFKFQFIILNYETGLRYFGVEGLAFTF